jgi:hypothetical protein
MGDLRNGEVAVRHDGTIFSDHEVRAALVKKGFENAYLEWIRSSVEDVKTVLTELRTGQRFTGTHHETFVMRWERHLPADSGVAQPAAGWPLSRLTARTPYRRGGGLAYRYRATQRPHGPVTARHALA